PVLVRRRRTSRLIWCLAIICAVLTVAVIVAGIVACVGYVTIRPKVPRLSLASAQANAVYFDEAGSVTVQVTVVVRAENDNAKASATFYGTNFELSFYGRTVAHLVADQFGVRPNASVELPYVVQSSPVPLSPQEAEAVSSGLSRGSVVFEMVGSARTRWSVGVVGSVRFWLNFRCVLRLPVNGTVVYPRCSSR
ncbi:hypothetical protein M569_12109, partial [Genlisea aurea]